MIAESIWNSSAVYTDFPDYDCRWAGPIAYSTETWSHLREQLREGGPMFSPSALALSKLAVEQDDGVCQLGRLSACWALHVAGVSQCERTEEVFPLLPALGSRWPLLRTWLRAGNKWSCSELFHPSISWDYFHELVDAVALEEFDEEDPQTLVSRAFETAGNEATGIIWKYSSSALYEHVPVAAWTGRCAHGVASAFLFRACGLILGDQDVFKMVESAMSRLGRRGEIRTIDLLDSRWSLLPLLHRLQSVKRRWDDLAISPEDLQPSLPRQQLLRFLSPTARELASKLMMGAPGPVLTVFVSAARVQFLERYVEHARRIGIMGRMLILPQNPGIHEICIALADACLPVLSIFPDLAKYTLLAFAAQLSVDILFSDMDTYWVQNPFLKLLKHSDPGPDVYVPQEFYSDQSRPSIMLVRSSNVRSKYAMAIMATWLLRWPFISSSYGMRHLLEPERSGYVPSVSFLRPDSSEERGELQTGFLDSENEFVTMDGWFGSFADIVAFEMSPFLSESYKQPVLTELYSDITKAEQFLLSLQKPMSPKRPMEELQSNLHAKPAPVPEDARIIHVNFADGCCEVEQAKSSSTAQEFGANESRALNGSFLSAEFRARNQHLLNWVRSSEMTYGKTPSGKVGYYVWKPYVILETLKDPVIRWNDIVLWTDAGVHFIQPLRPLVHEYLAQSDVSATQTPMLEADVTKRDAFVLLDADYESIVRTNQVATGIILVRKTPLSIRFMENWLSACEDDRVITETPSVLGLPEYPQFRHHNDDQSAFSLLFKKYGFQAFLQAERDLYVVAARNTAKFVAASDAFALGKSCSQDEYISAANAAAGSSEAESKKTLAARARSLAVSNPTRSKDATRGPWHRY
ncbi:Nucleotid_trans domain-containing protein [Durusdinium trenchii]|uniref:Nucleotid_trans domain-containing protein n=1 Tax=Durusdinium trenchii TaxID=1381693 RepID=A0ABP0JSU9_9DINO